MSREEQKQSKPAKKKAPKKQAASPQKQMTKRPNPRRPRGTGGKMAAEIVISVALVAFVGYQGFHMYHSLQPISQGTEGMELTSDMSEAATEPQNVYENVSVSNEDVHAGDLILVNANTAYVEENPSEIVSIYDHKTDNYHVSGTETSLRQQAVDALNQMLDAFYVATGHQDMIVISGYRTNAQQQELYDEDLQATGEQTSTRVALPGHSEHESGYSLDFSLYEDGVQSDYDGTGEYAWINENCSHYGYVLRYTEDKQDTTGIKWDKEADVVIVGGGAAGLWAAVQAYDNNLSAIVLEKQPEESAGGDVRCCGGYLFPISTDPNVLMSTGSFGEANEDLVYGIDEYGTDAIDWLVAHKYMEWADQPYVVIDGAGPGIYKGLLQAAIDAEAEILYETPGLSLITSDEGEVVGVVAGTKDEPLNVKAHYGVLLATRSEEHTSELQSQR